MTLIGNTIRNGAICATAAWAGNAIKGTISLEELKDVELEQLPKMATDYVQSIAAKVTRENVAHFGYGIVEFGKSAIRSFIHFKLEGPIESIAASLSEHKLALAAGATFGVAATVINSLLARVPQLKDQKVARLAASAAISGAAIYVATQQLPFATDPALVEKIAARVGILALGSFFVAKIVGTCMRADVKAPKVVKAAVNNGEVEEIKRRLEAVEKQETPKPVVDEKRLKMLEDTVGKLMKELSSKRVGDDLRKEEITDLQKRVAELEKKSEAFASIPTQLNAMKNKIGDLEFDLSKFEEQQNALKTNESVGEVGEEGKSTPTNTPQKNNVQRKVIQLEELGNK